MMHDPDLEVIYIDETTFHLWMSPSRVWQKEGMTFQMNNDRGPSITVISSISELRGIIHTEVFKGSNN